MVRAALVLAGAAAIAAMLHCSIERIPHVYCDTNDDCLQQSPYPSCDPMHHTCIAGDGGTVMDGDGGGAGPDMFCGSSAECSDVAPICAAARCRGCEGSGDDAQCVIHNPATPRCNSASARCVACLMSPDCPKATPVCNVADFTCHKCVAHGECKSGVCKADGTCADGSSEIAYVNNGATCTDTVHDSSPPNMPYCQIQYAATNASRPYVLVSASATAYQPISLSAAATAIGPLTIVGPAGRGTAAKATVAQAANAAVFAVATAGAPMTLTIDGLDLLGAGSPSATAGVHCAALMAGVATLTVKNSTISMSGLAGVDSSGCVLALDANIISGNANEGVKLASTMYTITNNIIASNGDTNGSVGVTIDSASNGTFAFNTVANNGGLNVIAGGIGCPTAVMPRVIEESIVAQNAHNPASNGTQFSGNCMLKNVVTGPDSLSGAIQQAPAFVSSMNFHLDLTPGAALTANQACCIDQIPTATTPNANHDVDLTMRPKVVGGKWDIGAHEAQ